MTSKYFESDDQLYRKCILEEYDGKRIEDLDSCVDILRKWVDTQPHLPEKPSYRLLRFVILFNKFSIEKAKQKLDMYYTIRSIIPEMHSRHPLAPEMVLQSEITYCVPLPKITRGFKRVIYIQMNKNFGPECYNPELAIIHIFHVMQLIILEDNCFNFHFVIDNVGFKIGHVSRVNPMVIRKASIIFEKIFSNRAASILMVNFHPYMKTVLNNVLIPMLNPKLRERVKVYTGCEILIETFGKTIIPKDAGGEEKSLEELNKQLLKKFEEHRERFDKLQTLRVDESLRPSTLVNDDLLGYYGSFKKLSID